MTLAEFNAACEAAVWRERQEWLRTAQEAAWIMNMWVPRGKPGITVKRLLGEDFFRELSGKAKVTKEEWEESKRSIEKMARFHSKVLRQIRAGTRPTETVVNVTKMQAEGKER